MGCPLLARAGETRFIIVMTMRLALLVFASGLVPTLGLLRASIASSRSNQARAPPALLAGKGVPPIKSRYFAPLGSPQNYTQMLERAPAQSVSVVKFQAPFCRTCRATSPLLDRVAKQYPEANFYSMDLVRNGKAAGERMKEFYQARGIKAMPYVEIFIGQECVETEVVPASAISTLESHISAALERLRDTSTPRGRNRQLVLLRQFLRAKADELSGARENSPLADAPPASQQGGFGQFLAASRWQAGAERDRHSAHGKQAHLPQRGASGSAKRGAPLRGATGGRRKGWR